MQQPRAALRCAQVNRTIQAFMYTMLADEDTTAAKKSLDVLITLYKKRVCLKRGRRATSSWAHF